MMHRANTHTIDLSVLPVFKPRPNYRIAERQTAEQEDQEFFGMVCFLLAVATACVVLVAV